MDEVDILYFSNPSYDGCIVGYSHDNRAIYNYNLMVEYLMKEDGMSYDDAVDFIDYNTIRSLPYLSSSKTHTYPNGPIVMYDGDEYEI